MRIIQLTLLLVSAFYTSSTYGQGQTSNQQIEQSQEYNEKNISEMMNPWIGRTKKELLLDSGPPTSTYPDGDGGEIMTYEYSKSAYFHSAGRSITVTQYYSFYVNSDKKIYHWKVDRSSN